MPLDQEQFEQRNDSSVGFFEKPMAMGFLDHLEELRKRLLYSALAIAVCTGLAFYFADELIALLTAPMQGQKLYVTEVTGSFMAYFKISLFAGLILALPFVFYQLWSFVSPGLRRSEIKMVLPLVLVSTLLFASGAAFCYFLILPVSLKFLLEFSGDLFQPMITVSSYIGFVGGMVLAFGLGFQIPVIAFALAKMGMVTGPGLAGARRYAVMVILIASAILTPTPDIVTQLLLAGPIYILYEASIVIAYVVGRKQSSH